MRWVVELSAESGETAATVTVDGESWKSALEAARSGKALPKYRCDFEADGSVRVLDLKTNERFVLRPMASVAAPAPSAPSTPAPGPVVVDAAPRRTGPSNAPPPAESPPRPGTPGPTGSVRPPPPAQSASLPPPATPGFTTPRPSSPSLAPAAGEEPVTIPPPATLLFQRNREATASSPLAYRERVLVVPAGSPAPEAERVARDVYRSLRQRLAPRGPGQFISVAVFDHPFRSKPERPPLLVLNWKDWRGDEPELTFATPVARPVSVAPQAAPNVEPAAPAAPQVAPSAPPTSVPTPPVATPPVSTAPTATAATVAAPAAPTPPVTRPALETATSSAEPAPERVSEPAPPPPARPVSVSPPARPSQAKFTLPMPDAQGRPSRPAPPGSSPDALLDAIPAAPKLPNVAPAPAPSPAETPATAAPRVSQPAPPIVENDRMVIDAAIAEPLPPRPPEPQTVIFASSTGDAKPAPPPVGEPETVIIAAAPAPPPAQAAIAPPPSAPPTAATSRTAPAARKRGDELLSDAFEATQDLAFLDDPTQACALVAKIAREILDAPMAVVSLYDIDRDELVLQTVDGGEGSPGVRAPLAQGPRGDAAIRNRVVVLSAPPTDDPLVKTALPGPALYVAARHDRRLFAVLELHRAERAPVYDTDEQHTASYVAAQLGQFLAEHSKRVGFSDEPRRPRR